MEVDKKYWVEILARSCVDCLDNSDEYSHQIKVLKLFISLNRQITDERLGGKSIRSMLDDPEKANDMVKAIKDHVKNSAELKNSAEHLDDHFKEKEIGVKLTVALASVIGARLDDNYRTMEMIIEWCKVCFPDGYTPEQFIMLRAAEYYYKFGKYRHLGIRLDECNLPELPKTSELDELLEAAKLEDAKIKSDDYHYRVQLFLVEAVAQLSLYSEDGGKGLGDYSNWLLNEKRKNLKNFEQPRFLYVLSQIEYARGHLDDSIYLTIEALQEAVSNDVDFIERCRARLILLEQEKVATDITVETTLDKAGKIVDKANEKLSEDIDKTVREETGKILEKVKEDVKSETKKSEELVRGEIRESLLRVIEILGIFLAVTGVAVTMVGGMTAGNTLGQTLTIYGIGNGTILIMFGFLRAIVHKNDNDGKFRIFCRKLWRRFRRKDLAE